MTLTEIILIMIISSTSGVEHPQIIVKEYIQTSRTECKNNALKLKSMNTNFPMYIRTACIERKYYD